ncbi:hypothetical protein AAFF_G00364730 [Aldrovandia affinis]|uniref:Toll-like receptor 4 n=1 Tax=Aldrovandia affinis TaxID=143900 RepID=A0AAD7SJU3_9TELE|nr:hypothetical protein AAFF_G00364730 [Aldrovandia affinis]
MQGLSSLKVLIISGNSFHGDTIHDVFANLTNLEHLDISNCGIEDLNSSSFTQLNKLRSLALSSNRLLAVDFLTSPGLVVLTHIDTMVAHKYKFYLRYGCILLRGYRNPKCVEFQYDAFVIYSSKDEAWVMEELVENIEGGMPPIQLCLHIRDFEAGKSITSNIIDEGIMGSRKVIVVVSQHFISSAWCCFEFEIAQSWLVLERNAGLLLIILEDVEEENTKKVIGLHKYLKKNTYLKWKGNALSNTRFWNRLRKAIIAGK